MVGVPVFPVADPGAAVSPGAKICNFANEPTFTVIEGLVFAVFVGSVTSDRVSVPLPTVRRVTLKVLAPETSAAFAGNAALLSLERIPTVSVAEFTRFQFASTARAVTANATPDV